MELVEIEISTLPDQDYLVLDPDSRLTQLGVLPLAATASLIAVANRAIPLKLLFPNSRISG